MALEADRITGLVLTDDVVRPELNVVLEEQNMRVANNPARGSASRSMPRSTSIIPMAGRSIGWRHEIEKLDRDDALAFYRRFYTPNNAIVVVAGDVTAEEVKADAEETYGKIAARAEIDPRQRPDRAGAGGAAHRHAGRFRGSNSRASRRDYLVPSETTAKPGESEALDVLAHVLGSGENSRLYRALVVDKGIALNAGAYYSGTALDYAKFGVYGSPKPGTTLHRGRGRHRRRAGRYQRSRRHRRRTRSRQDPADRRGRLRPGQSGDAWRAGTARRSPPARPSTWSTPGPTASAP